MAVSLLRTNGKADNEPVRLLAYLIAALQMVCPLKGHLDERRISRFEGWAAMLSPNGETLLVGLVQAALHSVLGQICDLGIPLLEVRCVEARGLRSA
jgi:hypothetical protein